MNNRKQLKKYLPSKQFAVLISFIIVLLVVVFLIFFFVSKREKFTAESDSLKEVSGQTILDIIQSDIDGDSVPDWEEALWGTDKTKPATFAEVPDAKYIESKKKELNIEDEVNDHKLNQTEQFAQQFFTTYVALKANGQDADSINNFSKALGDRIADPTLVDKYKEEQIIISKEDNEVERAQYYEKMQILFKKYEDKGLGEELSIVNSGLISSNSTEDNVPISKLNEISSAYQQFASKALLIEVPEGFTEYHLKIVNSSNNIGTSVKNMTQIVSDPLVGITGLSQYQKYSEELVKTVGDLETALE